MIFPPLRAASVIGAMGLELMGFWLYSLPPKQITA
jgi:hypothetical protein